MITYIVRRVVWAPVLLLAASLFVFVLGHYGPGDPVEVALGQHYTEERIFRVAPLHHHVYLGGLSEPKVIVRFWIIGLLLAMVGFTALRLS